MYTHVDFKGKKFYLVNIGAFSYVLQKACRGEGFFQCFVSGILYFPVEERKELQKPWSKGYMWQY